MNARFSKLPSIGRTAAIALALSGGLAAAAVAQPGPPGPPPPALPAGPLPSYATPVTDQQIRGRISAVTGKYTLEVRDERGYLDSVTLHQGTVITPTGLTLAPGMQVTITGNASGSTFAANQIDTPYSVTVIQGAPFYGAGFGWGPGWGPGWGWGRWGGWGPGYGAGLWW